MTLERVLVAGIGNIFLGDDAFGVELAWRLAARPLTEGVEVVDFGIRGFDLARALLEDYALVILLDALPRGGEPGTLYLLEPALEVEAGAPLAGLAAHSLDPVSVLGLARALGGRPRRLLVVGCEPASIEANPEGRMELTRPVAAALEEAIGVVESLLAAVPGPVSSP